MKRQQRRRSNQDGFTLIEIMVVILILGLLATIVVQSLRGATDKAKRVKAQADIAELKTGLDRYYLDAGSYPTSDQGLPVTGCGAARAAMFRPTMSRAVTCNRFRRIRGAMPYFYQSDGNSYVLKSFGADGVEGGEGKNADIDGSQN